MDKNTTTGLILIGAVVIAFKYEQTTRTSKNGTSGNFEI